MANQIAKFNTDVGPYKWFKPAWTGTSADYNAIENGPGGSVGCASGVCARGILVAGLSTGNLVVKDQAGNTITIPAALFVASPFLKIQLSALVASGSTNCTVMLFW